MKNKGLTFVGVLVTIIIIAFVIFIFTNTLDRARSISWRLMCGTNLSGLAKAMMIYSNDYNEEFPMLGDANDIWADKLGFDFYADAETVEEALAKEKCPVTLTANWYLLIKYADILPEQFVCQKIKMKKFKYNVKKLPGNIKDLTELWDFGPEPFKHCSYATYNRYNEYKLNAASPADLPLAAEPSPWFDIRRKKEGQIVRPRQIDDSYPSLLDLKTIEDMNDRTITQMANSAAHENKGQNVLYGDGHVKFEKKPTVGVDNDNIYTYWSGDGSKPEDKQIGKNPTSRDTTDPKENQPQDANDTFLVL